MAFNSIQRKNITNAGYTQNIPSAQLADVIYISLAGNLVLVADVLFSTSDYPPNGSSVTYIIDGGNGSVDLNGFVFRINGVDLTQEQLKAGLIFYNTCDGVDWDVPIIISSQDASATSPSLDGRYLVDESVVLGKLEDLTRGSIIRGYTSDRPTPYSANTNLATLVGDGTDINSVVPSGDWTWTNAGVNTIGNDKITTVKVLNNNITNAKLAQMASLTVKANITGGTANAADVPLANLAPYAGGWTLLGNAGTTAGTNFIGTTDAIDLVFKVNNDEAGRLSFGGNSNTSLGRGALISYTSGSGVSNTAIGAGSLTNLTTGQLNTGVGVDSLNLSVNGDHNTAIGRRALFNVTSGIDNTAVGYNACDSVLSTGSYNTMLGDNTEVDSSSALHRIAIGYGATATEDYQFAIPTDITTIAFGTAEMKVGPVIEERTTISANATATLTAAQVRTGYITSTSAAVTVLTLPTGTLLGAELGAARGTIHEFYIDNTLGANTVTVAVAVDGVLSSAAVANGASQGLLTVPSGVTGIGGFRIVFSSATTYVFTRIS